MDTTVLITIAAVVAIFFLGVVAIILATKSQLKRVRASAELSRVEVEIDGE
jgi:sensor domain CHASE-containing protein